MNKEAGITNRLEETRQFLNVTASRKDRSEIGQFFTPAAVACFMASLVQKPRKHVRILDPGAGTGILFAAIVQELTARRERPESIEVVAYETDESMKPHLEKTMRLCDDACRQCEVKFSGVILVDDFISSAIAKTELSLFSVKEPLFTHAILNPPYKKICGDSDVRRALKRAGIETSNFYSAFVWLSAKMLDQGGELVAITPRSFCNGPYFLRFRRALIDLIGLRRLHMFHSRKEAFRDDSVLQENIVFYGVRGEEQPSRLTISVSNVGKLARAKLMQIPWNKVVLAGDSDVFIHLAEDDDTQIIMERMSAFKTNLGQLGLNISTGRVVDFRARKFLRENPGPNSAPLLYPCHFSEGFIKWPLPGAKKPNAIAMVEETRDLLVPPGYYVLTKRFSAKEEQRRVVAAVCDPRRFRSQWIGFENHLNYFHAQGKGLSPNLAKGLALFLNCTLFDRHFRLFSGHTQVNATDLRKVRYPSYKQLSRIGRHVKNQIPNQQAIDEIIEKECGING